jgi:V/A-type H+-transporting ATPase subunit I
MKKATILFETGDAKATVTRLRTLGVLHVEHQNLPESRDITALQEKVTLVNSSFDVLNQVLESGKNIPPQDAISGDWKPVVDRIIELGKRHEQLESTSRGIIGQINEWERWGDVDLHQIRHLREHGIFLGLYQVPEKKIGDFPDDVIVKTIFTAGNIAHCAAISRRQFECPFPEIIPPKQGLSALKTQLAENTDTVGMIKKEILKSARFHEALLEIKRNLMKEIEFQQVLSGMGREGAISYVTGYIPFDMEEQLVDEARQRRWGVMVTEPTEVDEVPTLIRNPKWVSLITPVLGLLGLTPGYRELDVSCLFLIFFGIFFGILIGDAGYGLAYILITLVLQKLVLKKMMIQNAGMKTTFVLFYLLGTCAVIWGLLTGTFFGQAWFLALGYKPLVPQLNDTSFMQTFCFFLGALHLSIAHSWRALLKFPSLTLFADIGWICVLWTAFFVARTLILGDAFPPFGIWLIASGIILVILFTHPQRNVLKGIGTGLGTVALSLMNNFTDVISYIRLFAVGLATLAIAETTNTLAFGFGDGIVALVAGVGILITGHGLNIILGPMSVLVHGVRLNVLEFSGHANVIWSGTAFEPLREE